MPYRFGMEHYGPYGENCMNTGQFDAGECWLCQIKRLKGERDAALDEKRNRSVSSPESAEEKRKKAGLETG